MMEEDLMASIERDFQNIPFDRAPIVSEFNRLLELFECYNDRVTVPYSYELMRDYLKQKIFQASTSYHTQRRMNESLYYFNPNNAIENRGGFLNSAPSCLGLELHHPPLIDDSNMYSPIKVPKDSPPRNASEERNRLPDSSTDNAPKSGPGRSRRKPKKYISDSSDSEDESVQPKGKRIKMSHANDESIASRTVSRNRRRNNQLTDVNNTDVTCSPRPTVKPRSEKVGTNAKSASKSTVQQKKPDKKETEPKETSKGSSSSKQQKKPENNRAVPKETSKGSSSSNKQKKSENSRAVPKETSKGSSSSSQQKKPNNGSASKETSRGTSNKKQVSKTVSKTSGKKGTTPTNLKSKNAEKKKDVNSRKLTGHNEEDTAVSGNSRFLSSLQELTSWYENTNDLDLESSVESPKNKKNNRKPPAPRNKLRELKTNTKVKELSEVKSTASKNVGKGNKNTKSKGKRNQPAKKAPEKEMSLLAKLEAAKKIETEGPNRSFLSDSDGELSVNESLSDISIAACMRSVLAKGTASISSISPVPMEVQEAKDRWAGTNQASESEGMPSPLVQKNLDRNRLIGKRGTKTAKKAPPLKNITNLPNSNPTVDSIMDAITSKNLKSTPKAVKKAFRKRISDSEETEESSDSD